VASALPVKLLIPLFICFLPGIFVSALGPPYFQFIQTVGETVTRSRNLPLPSPPSNPLP
jgi:hypothetical protein